MATQLKARGDTVVAAVRKSSAALEQLGVRIETDCDVTDSKALRQLSERLSDVKLDWLLCNAGVLTSESLDRLDEAAILRQFQVNALGPLLCVAALKGQLRDGGKIGLITSRMGSIADNTSGGMYGYRMSKVALNMAGVSLARDLAPRRIAVALLHPGFVKTEMTGGNGNCTPEEAARGLIARMDELSLADSGSFWHQSGERLPW
jgi:NAD(P)-dependent dehydrogenase (short-subunit alcohol dehydrogenase family)